MRNHFTATSTDCYAQLLTSPPAIANDPWRIFDRYFSPPPSPQRFFYALPQLRDTRRPRIDADPAALATRERDGEPRLALKTSGLSRSVPIGRATQGSREASLVRAH